MIALVALTVFGFFQVAPALDMKIKYTITCMKTPKDVKLIKAFVAALPGFVQVEANLVNHTMTVLERGVFCKIRKEVT